jgi:glutathione peroxidase
MVLTTAFLFSFPLLDGGTLALSDYQGKVMLIVNTASQCGFTPQYKGLEELYNKYKEQGLVIIGVPSNDFGHQEPGSSEEIKCFVKDHYSVTFPMTAKQEVKGENADPFYKWANQQVGFIGSPKWNFHKYLINKNGELVDWFSSVTSPTSSKVTKAIEKALAE